MDIRKILKITMILSLVFIVSACSSISGETSKTIVRSDAEIIQYDKNELVNEADVILSGAVISQEVESDFEGFPATDTIIKVNEVYKGNPGETVEIRVNGGELNEMIYILDEEVAPTFKIGEEVIVFLTSNRGSRPDKEDFEYYLVGQAQGKFNIGTQKDSLLQNNTHTHSFKFSDFQNEIYQIDKYNKENDIPKIHLPEGQESNI